MPLTDAARRTSRTAILPVPGRDIGLQLLLDKTADGSGRPGRAAVPRHRRTAPTAPPIVEDFRAPTWRSARRASPTTWASRSPWSQDFSDYTLLIAKHDPGQGIVWLAFASLIAGITITFYLPRRRVWTRLTSDGRLGIVWRSDRYVDVEREFGRLLDDLVAARATT